ncbi:MAG: winged helix-turn-helix transcriptional regulator [Hyphomonas sp.]|nr:winged helix-turn-helix transcriptional regulator [Hyphomonas sp.]
MWGYFLKAYKAVVDRVDKRLRADSQLTLAEFELMYALNNGGGRVRFIDLANVTLLSQSRISRQIDSLQKRGLLLREITDSNRRATYAVLTEEGKAAYDEAEQVFLSAYYSDFRNLIPAEDVDAFRRVLGILLQEPDYPKRSLELLEAAFEENFYGPRKLFGRKPSNNIRAKSIRKSPEK